MAISQGHGVGPTGVGRQRVASWVAWAAWGITAASTFEVTDDGVGFDPAETGYGTGLQGMADRLAAIGGDFEVRTRAGSGTTVTGAVPVHEGGAVR
jgi:glucose-6-phosphate-specific signal transduction histidine kinase